MTRFLIRRIVLGLITLWVIITLVFILYYARPGVDPARELAGRAVTPQLLANINKEYGFNQPVIVQYWHYLERLVPIPGHFNLGISNTNRLPVTTIIAAGGPHRHLARGRGGGHLDGCSASASECSRRAGHAASGTGARQCSCSPASRCRRSSSACCCSTSSTTS